MTADETAALTDAMLAMLDKGQPIRLLVQGIDSGVRAVGCNERRVDRN